MPRNPLYTLLRLSIAFIWLWTGLSVLLFYPLQESLQLIAPLGLPQDIAILIIEGTAILELFLGAVTLLNWQVRAWALLQMVLIAGFTLIITFFLPAQWVHPFGPVSKNIPLLAATAVLYSWETERLRQRTRLFSFYDDETEL